MVLLRTPRCSGAICLIVSSALAGLVACTAADPISPALTSDVSDTSSVDTAEEPDGEPEVAPEVEPAPDVPVVDATPDVVEDTAPTPDTPDPEDAPETSPDVAPEVVEDVVDPPDGELPNYAGEWAGTWEAEGPLPLSGSFVLVLEPHEGEVIEGEATFTGAPCFSFAYVDATIQRGAVTATLFEDEISISVTGTISATQLDATFEAVDAGICSGYTGVITATRLSE